MRLEPRIHVTQPKFELYEHVTCLRNGHNYDTRIIQRWYSPDEEMWLYRVYGSEDLCTIDELEPRLEAVG